MKKFVSILLVLALAVTVLCGGTSAAEARPETAGIYNIQKETISNVTFEAKACTSTGTEVTAVDTYSSSYPKFCEGAEYVQLTYTGAANGSFVLCLSTKEETTAPTASDILYIDQTVATSNRAVFNIYPKSLDGGTTYYVYMIGSGTGTGNIGELTKVASFQYYEPYTLGDVTGEGNIDGLDAMQILFHEAELVSLSGNKFLAADVTKDKAVNSLDAMKILYYSVELISSLE